MKKKILHLNNSNVKSNYLISIAKLYDKDKYDLTIGCTDSYGELHIELDKIKCRNLHFSYNSIDGKFSTWFKIFSFLKKEKIQILHLHTFWTTLFGGIIGRLTGVKVIYTRHHADYHIKLNKKIHIFLDGLSAKMADKVIAVSEYTRSIMMEKEKVDPNKVITIHNGLEQLKRSKDIKNEKDYQSDYLLMLLRVHPEKNIETAIRALHKLRNRNILMYIAGSSPDDNYKAELIELAKDLDLDNRVKFLGFRNDVRELILNSKMLVHPSLGESFGFVLVEALSLGIPIVCSKLDVFDEVVGQCAFYYTPIKNSNALADQIKFVLNKNNKTLVDEKAIMGKQLYLNKYTMDSMVIKYEEVYENV